MCQSTTFEREVDLPVAAQEAFAWHERPGALDRLIPPWESVSVLERGDGIKDGSTVVLGQNLGPVKMKWVAKHHSYEPGKSFQDTQASGPFAAWDHLHEFQSKGEQNCVLRDHIEYKLPGGFVGKLLGRAAIQKKIDAMFTYRHRTTVDDLAAHARYRDQARQTVAVTGASGLVGSAFTAFLTTGGHQVVKLVRGEPMADQVRWDANLGDFDAGRLDGIDACVHLAGENIAGARWNQQVKQKIRDSRVVGTRKLCEGLARMANPPKVLVCASAIGLYGDRGDEMLTEESEKGSGFLSDVVQEWEDATQPARDAGIRVVNARFGVILSPKDGALSKMLLPFKLGGGGRVGSGKQFWSWVSIDDAVGALHHAMLSQEVSGPMNVVAPESVTNLEFTKTLGRVLRRPTVVPMPTFAARLALGEMANELLLSSTRVTPKVLSITGYQFRQPNLEDALRHLLGCVRE